MTDASAVTRPPAGRTEAPNRAVSRSWIVVAGQELRDLWLSGRGLTLMVAYTAVLSGSTYVVAINEDLNFVEQREAVSLTLKLAVVVGWVVGRARRCRRDQRRAGTGDAGRLAADAGARAGSSSSARGSPPSPCGRSRMRWACRTCGGWAGTSARSAWPS